MVEHQAGPLSGVGENGMAHAAVNDGGAVPNVVEAACDGRSSTGEVVGAIRVSRPDLSPAEVAPGDDN